MKGKDGLLKIVKLRKSMLEGENSCVYLRDG